MVMIVPNTGWPIEGAYKIFISFFPPTHGHNPQISFFLATVINPIPCQMNESSEITQIFVTD